MTIKEKQEISEKTCVEKFIYYYNKENNSSYNNIVKNSNQNEIDVFINDNNENILNVQITKIFRDFEKGLGKMISNNIKNNINIYNIDNYFVKDGCGGTRTGKDVIKEIEDCINKKIEKYKKQKLDVSNLILLLDSNLPIPEIFINNYQFIYKDYYRFKEIYIVCNNYIKKIN